MHTLQNMTYGTLTHYTIILSFFFFCIDVYDVLRTFSKQKYCSKVFWHVWCVLYNKLVFWISGSDTVFFFSVYGNILWRYRSTFFDKTKIEEVPRSVTNFRTNYFFEIWVDFGPKWSPYVAETLPYVAEASFGQPATKQSEPLATIFFWNVGNHNFPNC